VSADLSWDAVWTNVHLATIDPTIGGADGYGSIRDGALGVRDGRIAWVGPRRDLPSGWRAESRHDGRGGTERRRGRMHGGYIRLAQRQFQPSHRSRPSSTT